MSLKEVTEMLKVNLSKIKKIIEMLVKVYMLVNVYLVKNYFTKISRKSLICILMIMWNFGSRNFKTV